MHRVFHGDCNLWIEGFIYQHKLNEGLFRPSFLTVTDDTAKRLKTSSVKLI